MRKACSRFQWVIIIAIIGLVVSGALWWFITETRNQAQHGVPINIPGAADGIKNDESKVEPDFDLKPGSYIAIPPRMLDLIDVKVLDQKELTITDDFASLAKLSSEERLAAQRVLDNFIVRFAETELANGQMVVKEDGQKFVRLDSDAAAFGACFDEVNAQLEKTIGIDRTKLCLHFLKKEFREGGAQKLEVAFSTYGEGTGYRIEFTFLKADGSLDYFYEGPQATEPDFKLFKRWAHLDKLIPK